MKCPKCKKNFGYVRLNKQEWCCRNCGTVSPLQESQVVEEDTLAKPVSEILDEYREKQEKEVKEDE